MKFILLVGFWFCLIFEDSLLVFMFSILFGIYLLARFKNKFIVYLWILLACSSLLLRDNYIQAKEGIYIIEEIKTNYCIAGNKESRIIVYGLENPNFGDSYYFDEFDEIVSVKNIHQFNFEDYMHSKNIYESTQAGDNQLISYSNSIKAKLYNKLKNNEVLCMYLYGIKPDNDSYSVQSRLSIPFLVCLYYLQTILSIFLSQNKSRLVCILSAIVYGGLFSFKSSLLRYILYQLMKFLIEDSFDSYVTSSFIFLYLNPDPFDFVFILTSGIQIMNHYIKDHKQFAITLYLYSLQFIYFHEINVILFLLFPLLKNLNALLFCFSFVSDIPSFNISNLVIHYVPDVLFYVFLICVFYCLFNNKIKFIPTILLILSPFFTSYVDPFFHVYTIDIGQGDCTLIVEPYKKSSVMIDCEANLYKDNVNDIIVPVLEDLQIHSLDTLIITHDDFDHSGGKEELLKQIEVKQVVDESSQKVNVDYPFYLLLPERISNDENDNSIVSYFQYDDMDYLWMGDASINIEKQLLNTYDLKVDVLKLGHHGSNTSSSFTFLEKINPKLGIISVGENNRYHHPSSEVVSNCHLLGIDLLMTKDVGMIHIFSCKQFTFFVTATGLFGFI